MHPSKDLSSLQEFYGNTFSNHEKITDLSNYELIKYLQQQFNHQENSIPFSDKVAGKKAFDLLLSEYTETMKDGIEAKNLQLVRDGIADQLTVAHFLAFKIDGLHNVVSEEPLSKNSTFEEYRAQTEVAFNKLQASFYGDDAEIANLDLARYIQVVGNVPQNSNIDIDYDLLSVTFSSLTKICEDKVVADQTLQAYADKGYDVHIESVPSGFAIFTSSDFEIKVKNSDNTERTEVVPKGKFLKSIYKLDPFFKPIQCGADW